MCARDDIAVERQVHDQPAWQRGKEWSEREVEPLHDQAVVAGVADDGHHVVVVVAAVAVMALVVAIVVAVHMLMVVMPSVEECLDVLSRGRVARRGSFARWRHTLPCVPNGAGQLWRKTLGDEQH
jgi:hypothetical protein